MPSTTDISPLSITDGKISNEARIAHAKLAKATEGQVLVAQADGKFAAKSLAGDVTLDSSGNTTSNVAVSSDGTTVVTGATGATGEKGDTGSQGATGATGPAGTDATVTEATVNAAGAVMHTDFPSTGFIKRGASSAAYTIDNSTYSTTGHTHAHADLTSIVAAEHVDWAAASAGTIHATNYTHTHDLSDVTDSGTAAALNVPAAGNAASGEVVKGSDTRLTDTRTPSSTLAHKSTHETGESDALSPSDIGAEAAFSKNTAFNKNFGTATSTVCQGDDSRLSDTRTPSSTLAHKSSHETGESDALSPSDIGAESAFSKNTAFNKNFGTASGDVCQGNDSRLSDARTPAAHASTHATSAADAIAPSDIGAEPSFSKNTAHNKNFGTAAGTVCQGNDSRLSDARTPSSTLAHKASHETGGSDALSPSDIGASANTHTHDSRYYQESEFLNASAGSGDAGKPVKLDADGQIDTSMINSGDVSFVDLDDLPSTFTPSTHSHDAMSSGNSYATGFVPAGSGTHADNFLRKDGTWVVPTGTSSYTADDGIGLTGTAFSVAAGTGLTQDSTGLSLNLQGVAETAVRVDQDYIVFLDGGSTGAAKKESIGDLATAMAGTGITAAAGELNASNSMGKYIRWITWGTTQSDITYNGDDSIATINHGLGSQYVTVALIDVDGVATEGGANSLSDVDYICIIKCIDTNNITIEWNMTFAASGDSVPANNDFKLTVIG